MLDARPSFSSSSHQLQELKGRAGMAWAAEGLKPHAE